MINIVGDDTIKNAILTKLDYVEKNIAFGASFKSLILDSGVDVYIKDEKETLEDELNTASTLDEFRAYQKGDKIILFNTRYETEESMVWKFFHEITHFIFSQYIFVNITVEMLNQKYFLDNKIISDKEKVFFTQPNFTEEYRKDSVHENMPSEVMCNQIANLIMDMDLSRPWWRRQIKRINRMENKKWNKIRMNK